MATDRPDFVEKEVERGTYTGLVNAVLAQVSAGLSDHVDAADDIQDQAAKRLKTLSTPDEDKTPAKRAIEGLFALAVQPS